MQSCVYKNIVSERLPQLLHFLQRSSILFENIRKYVPNCCQLNFKGFLTILTTLHVMSVTVECRVFIFNIMLTKNLFKK